MEAAFENSIDRFVAARSNCGSGLHTGQGGILLPVCLLQSRKAACRPRIGRSAGEDIDHWEGNFCFVGFDSCRSLRQGLRRWPSAVGATRQSAFQIASSVGRSFLRRTLLIAKAPDIEADSSAW